MNLAVIDRHISKIAVIQRESLIDGFRLSLIVVFQRRGTFVVSRFLRVILVFYIKSLGKNVDFVLENIV